MKAVTIKKGTKEYKRGIRGISEDVSSCQWCKKQTNVFWQTNKYVSPVFACSLECAEKITYNNATRYLTDQGRERLNLTPPV